MFENKLKLMVTKPISQNQYDTLVYYVYNLGVNNLKSSTLLKKVNLYPNDYSVLKNSCNGHMPWVKDIKD